LIEGAKLVITSDLQIQKRMEALSNPNIFLDFKSAHYQFVRWRFLENLEDDILKRQIIAYSKLINAVSHIFHERGRLETDLVKQLSIAHTI
jgi:membrane-associated PAP2 superfamily phosphatase